MTTPAAAVSKLEILHAYRHLYRAFLRAVRFAKPARFVGRDALREAFRETSTTTAGGFDRRGVQRTLWFLQAADREAGLEHRILKRLIEVRWWRARRRAEVWRRIRGRLGEGKDAGL